MMIVGEKVEVGLYVLMVQVEVLYIVFTLQTIRNREVYLTPSNDLLTMQTGCYGEDSVDVCQASVLFVVVLYRT